MNSNMAPQEQTTVIRKRRPDRIDKLLISQSVMRPLQKHLQATGRGQSEEAALLAGFMVGRSVAVCTTALLPYTDHWGGGCEIPPDVVRKCSDFVRSTGMIFLAQIHTHPGRSFHSSTDDQWAISDAPGFFSIVIPYFARFGLKQCFENGASIYERMGDGSWQLLSAAEKRQRFRLLPAKCCVI